MTAETHPDPFQDALGHGLQRAVQIASCAVTAAQVYVYQQRTHATATAERDERARRALAAQVRAEREAARAGWAPALDPDWLQTADLFQTAAAWGTAMPYADRSVPWYEPAAATAMRKTEERLRDLHPHAMARYDRLRADGNSPADSMRAAAPLFAGPPHAYDAPYTPRPELHHGTGSNLIWTATPPASLPGELDGVALAHAQERRGMQIVAALQARARAEHRVPLGEAEQRTVLETITNLPADIIDRVVTPASAVPLPAAGAPEQPRIAPERSGTPRPWEHDFPVSIQDVVATASASETGGPSAAVTGTRRKTRGRHRH
jgi:hypothetical protein